MLRCAFQQLGAQTRPEGRLRLGGQTRQRFEPVDELHVDIVELVGPEAFGAGVNDARQSRVKHR